MNYLLSSILMLFYTSSAAQVIYQLHPSVKDTIDYIEKLEYSLFTITDNNGFNFATIQYNNSGFILIENRSLKKTNGLITEFNDSIVLTQEQITREEQIIEKINAYYYNLTDEGRNLKRKENIRVLERKLSIRFAGPKNERLMLKRARFCSFDESNLNNEFEMGLRPRKDQLDIKQ